MKLENGTKFITKSEKNIKMIFFLFGVHCIIFLKTIFNFVIMCVKLKDTSQ